MCSIALPWFFIRKVPVEIELVRLISISAAVWPIGWLKHVLESPRQKLPSSNLNAECSKVSWDVSVARPYGNTISLASSVRERKQIVITWLLVFKVSSPVWSAVPCPLKIYLTTGDFTKSLVKDPPKALWTRELKVNQVLVTQIRAQFSS